MAPPELKLTLTVPYSGDAPDDSKVNTGRMENSGLLRGLNDQATITSKSDHEAEFTFPTADNTAHKFAQRFLKAKQGYLYDFDNDQFNGKNEVVTEKAVTPITKDQITKLAAAIRTSKNISDWYKFFTDNGLTLEQYQLFKASGVYGEMGAHNATYPQAADQLLRAYNQRLKNPIAIRYWDDDFNLATLNDLYWVADASFTTAQPSLAAITSATPTPTAASPKNIIEYSLPELTPDMLARPESYLFYPLLLEKDRDSILLNTDKTGPVDPATYQIPKTSVIPSQEVLEAEIQRLLRMGSIKGVADYNDKAKDTYHLDPSYFRRTKIAGKDVVFLVLPKLEKWCDPANYVARTAAAVVGYVEFKFKIPADRLPHLRDALVVLPQQICSFIHTGTPGAQDHTLRIKAPPESIKQLREAAERVLEASKSGNSLTDSRDQKMQLVEDIVAKVNDAPLEKFIKMLEVLEKDTNDLYDYTNDPESNLWLYLVAAFVLVNLISEDVRKVEKAFLAKLRTAIFVRPSTVKSATAQYQPLLKRLPIWFRLKRDQVSRGARRLFKPAVGDFVPFTGQAELRQIVIERAKMPRGTVKSIGIVAEKGSGKSHFVESIIHDAATGVIPELAHLEFWYVTANGIQKVGSGISDIPAAVDELLERAEDPNVVIVIDEVQSTVDVGTHTESSISPFTEAILPKLEGKRIFAIVITTPKGRQYLRRKNAPLDDRFDWNKMPRLSPAELYEAMRGHANRVQKNRSITIMDNAVRKAIDLIYLISDKNENRGVADIFDSLVEFVKIAIPDKTEIDVQAVERFVAKEIREEKQFSVDGLIVEIQNIVKEQILKKLGLDLGELNLAEDVFRSLDLVSSESHADAIARLRRVLMVLQTQARILDDPFITAGTRAGALGIISQTLTSRDGTKANATTPEQLEAETQRDMMRRLQQNSPSPQPSPLEGEGKGEGEPPTAARLAPAPPPLPPPVRPGTSAPEPAAQPAAPRRIVQIVSLPPSTQPPAPPSAKPTDPNARATLSPSPQPSPLKGEGKRVNGPVSHSSPELSGVRTSADASHRGGIHDALPVSAGSINRTPTNGGPVGPQCIEPTDVLYEAGMTFVDGNTVRVVDVWTNPSVRPTSARLSLVPSPLVGEGRGEGKSSSALSELSFTDFVKALYNNNRQFYEAVLSHTPKQQLIDILTRMKALAKKDPNIRVLYEDVSLTYDFIKAFNRENPGFFKKPEAMLNLFVRSRFKDGSNTNLRNLSADQFVAVYAERRAAELERVRTMERKTLALRGNLRRGMKGLERTLREAERVRRR